MAERVPVARRKNILDQDRIIPQYENYYREVLERGGGSNFGKLAG